MRGVEEKRRLYFETDISTESDKKTQNPRFYGTYEHSGWKIGVEAPQSQRTETSGCVTCSYHRSTGLDFGKLRTSLEYREVYQNGRRYTDSCMTVFVLNRESKVIRFGITVTKKMGNAVKRNRIKRVLREALRSFYSQVAQPCDIVVIARKEIILLDTLKIEQRLERIFKKAGILASVQGTAGSYL